MIPQGYLYVFCCASSFALKTTQAKLTYNEGVSPEIVVILVALILACTTQQVFSVFKKVIG